MADDNVSSIGGGNNNGGGGGPKGPKRAEAILAEIKGEAAGKAAKAFKEKIAGMLANYEKLQASADAAKKDIDEAIADYNDSL